MANFNSICTNIGTIDSVYTNNIYNISSTSVPRIILDKNNTQIQHNKDNYIKITDSGGICLCYDNNNKIITLNNDVITINNSTGNKIDIFNNQVLITNNSDTNNNIITLNSNGITIDNKNNNNTITLNNNGITIENSSTKNNIITII